MKEKIEAKLREAQEKLVHWEQQQAIAAIQVERWDAVIQACTELLQEKPATQGKEGEEKEESPGE